MTRFLTGLALLAALAGAPRVGGETLPRSGTFTGYYRVDRWGTHWFGGFPVEPKSRDAFKDVHDKLVTAELEEIFQPINPGPGYVQRVGKITPVADAPVEIKIAWADDPDGKSVYRRIDRGGEFKFKLTVTNKLDRPLGPETVEGDGFFLYGVGGGANLRPGDSELDMAQDLRFTSTPSREWRQSAFEIAAGKTTTWTITVRNSTPGEFEFYTSFLEYRKAEEKWLTVQSNLLRLDIVDDRPKPAAGLEVDLVPEANPPRPPRDISAKLTLRNTGDKAFNFYLPYRMDKLAQDQILRCFDRAGTMIHGPRIRQSSFDSFGPRDVQHKPQRLEAGKSLVLGVILPGETALATAQIRGGFLTPKADRKAGEVYFDTGGPSASRYVIVRR